MKNGETIEFDIEGVNDYIKQASGNEPNHDYIADLSNMQSQLYVKGINELRNALLNADLGTSEGLDIYNKKLPELKKMLLEDLQNAVKVPMVQNMNWREFKDKVEPQLNLTVEERQEQYKKIPEDISKFYDQLRLPINQRKDEYKRFSIEQYSKDFLSNLDIKDNLQQLSSYGANQNILESVSAKILLDLENNALSPQNIKDNLDQYLSDYKTGQREFIKKDSDRYLITVKGPKKGEIKSITLNELDSLDLTGEQKDAFKLLCHQGHLHGYTVPLITKEQENGITIDKPILPINRVDALIDMSNNRVVVISCAEGTLLDTETGRTQPHVNGAIKLDLTELKGKELTPGCSSASNNKNILKFQFNKADSGVNFNLPSNLKTTPSHGTNWTEETQDLAKKAYLSLIIDPVESKNLRVFQKKSNNSETLGASAKEALGTLVGKKNVDTYITFAKFGKIDEIIELDKKTSSNPEGQKNIVNLYCSVEEDHSKQKQFALERFRGLVKQELSSSEFSESVSDRITKASELILSPLYTDETELKADKKNVIFEELAEHATKTISSSDPKDHQKAVNLFCLVDDDPSSQKHLAIERLSGCLESILSPEPSQNSSDGKTTITLDAETAKKMKEAIISILGEACTPKEREALEKNAGKIVRECADEAKTPMSWGQRFKRIMDHVQDLFKKHTAKDIIKEHPEIKATITKNLNQKKSDSKVAKNPAKSTTSIEL